MYTPYRGVSRGVDSHALPDDVLELIFLRLHSPICLLHAATTCKQWRRIIAGASFLRRFRSLRGSPPVAGVYYDAPCHPRHRPDVVTSPWFEFGIDGRFFSLDFLPDSEISPWVWRLEDSRGSLLLFHRLGEPQGSASYGSIVICEPLTQRFEMVDPPFSRFEGHTFLNAYLVDGESGGIGMENFRVVFRLHVKGIYAAAGMFTMGSNGHQFWSKISMHELMRNAGPSSELIPSSAVYWFSQGRKVAVLDKGTGEFTSIQLPEVEDWDFHKEMYDFVVTAGHDGTARIVISGASGDLKVFARLKSSGEWALARSVRLAAVIQDLPGYDPTFFVSDYALIQSDGTPVILLSPWRENKWWFHLDIDTMEVEPAADPDVAVAYPCELPWPPTLNACTSCHEA